jgi:hypothetical protein
MRNVRNWQDAGVCHEDAEKEPENENIYRLTVDSTTKSVIIAAQDPQQAKQAVANARKANASFKDCKFGC